ncbi:hypothetical protein Tco_0299278 [Tanacetum coccineum]
MFRMTQPTKGPSGNNTKVSVFINESFVPDVPQSHISNQASTSSHHVPQDRWSKDKHIKLVNIIGNPGEDMVTRSMTAKLTVALAGECLFANFLSEIEPKKALIKGYSDSDYVGCNMDRKSTSGACEILGGKLVCWSAKKQQSVAVTSAEAEYVAAVGCCASILWMNYDIHYKMVPIFCDNTSAIAISNNLVLHSRTKDHILKGDIELHFIPTEYQLADIFTKPLDEPTFTRIKAELGMLKID